MRVKKEIPVSTLRANHLEKSYKNRKVVKDVSLNVSQGEIVGLLGPNGAGKTTSFYMIVGLVMADAGSVTLDETNITSKAVHERSSLGLGYLPQEASVFRKLTAEDNIRAILELRKDLTPKQREQRLDELFEEFNISHIRESLGMSLSGGERRRVEIARALAQDPKIMLLDEPFAGIDPISVIDIKEIITHLKDSGIGVLITDHNVRETLDICERGYIVSQGSIICEGSPTDILANEEVRDVYLGQHFSL